MANYEISAHVAINTSVVLGDNGQQNPRLSTYDVSQFGSIIVRDVGFSSTNPKKTSTKSGS